MKLVGICGFALLLGAPVYAQVDLVGEWGQRQHEDQPERGPGPELGDYLGLPINDAARAKADAWDASLQVSAEIVNAEAWLREVIEARAYRGVGRFVIARHI